MKDELPELSLTDFVERVASTAPAPGAGAAGAVALALAAACVAKAFAISARHADDPEDLVSAAAQAGALSRRALEGAQRDAQDYEALIHDKGASGPKARLRRDGEGLLALSDEVRRLAAAYGRKVAPVMAGDLSAAEALLAASDLIHRSNLAEAAEG